MDDSARQESQTLPREYVKRLQALINEAYKTLGNPIVLFNMEYELLAFAENVVTDDWIWNEIVKNGVFSDEAIRFFLDECFIDDVAGAKSVTLLASDKLKYDRLYGRVFSRYNNTVANVTMVACNKPLEARDTAALEIVCEDLSREIRTSEFFMNYSILYDEKLIRYLLDDCIDNKGVYAGHISNLYSGLKTNLFVAVADVSKCGTAKNGLDMLRNLIKEIQPELKYAVYSDHIVIIASTDRASLSHKRDLPKLSRFFIENNIRAGVSGSFENLFNLRKYYNEALSALNDGRHMLIDLTSR